MTAAPEIRLHRDPLQPGRYERAEAVPGQRLIDWLGEHYPAGFGRPVVLHLNGAPLPIRDADIALQPGDMVHILIQPGGPAVGGLIIQAIISAAIAAVASIAFSLIFKPKRTAAQEMPAPDPIYSITGAQNAARLGEPVPVLYGQVVTVPDYASQPYVYFSGNNQYLDQLLVIGQGTYDLLDLLVGETPVSAMEGGAVQYWLFNPADHGQAMGAIEAATGIMENVVTSAEVGDQELSGTGTGGGETVIFASDVEFTAPDTIYFGPDSVGDLTGGTIQVSGSAANDGFYTIAAMPDGSTVTTVEPVSSESYIGPPPLTLTFYDPSADFEIGPFITCKPGVQGNRLMLDFVWPGGLYEVNEENGALMPHSVSFHIEYQAVSDSGDPLGGWDSLPITETAATNSAIRKTYSIDVAAGRYRVRVHRDSPPPANSRLVNAFRWTGLKFRVVPATGQTYGPACILAVRIKATNGIASAASSRLRAKVLRHLPPMGSGAAVASRSPADAFCDVLADSYYGAGRPLSEIDLDELARIATSWGGLAKFDGAFAQRSTIWEALSICLQTANASPLPLGQLMSVAQEGVKAARRQLFSDANTLRGSLAIGYTFDKPGDADGVRVEYRDPVTWNALYSTWPLAAVQPDQVQLFGCSDGVQAAQFARLLWNKRATLRRTVHFETELEGLLARLGDRIAVAAALPRWGASGVVVGVSGATLWLDQRPDWSGSGHLIVLRSELGQPSDPISVTPGPEPNTVQLGAPAPFPIFPTGAQESTHYVFGNSVQLVRDFTVQRMEPRGGVVVGIEGLAYDPAVFAETLPWLETAT